MPNVWTNIVEQLNRAQMYRTWRLTSTNVCCVHSNIYGLGNIHWIRYLTAVDSFHSTSSAIHTYHWMTSVSVHIPLVTYGRNSSSIGKEPVPKLRPIFNSKRTSTTSSLVSPAEQGGIIFSTNPFQGHVTVVLVCCIIEWEPDITCTWEIWYVLIITTTTTGEKTAFWSLTPKHVTFKLRLP